MQLTIFSNFLNHHQVGLADALYSLLGDSFHFVVTCETDPLLLKGGIDYKERNYCIQSYKDSAQYKSAVALATDSDVCVFGANALSFEIIRARTRKGKISFEMGERWFKRGLINILSPNLIKNMFYYHTLFRRDNFYKLCSGAYVKRDQNALMSYKNRCYKWGYFTHVDSIYHRERVDIYNNGLRMMWCGRLIHWKHPEFAVLLASHLKQNGYQFVIDIYGDGKEYLRIKQLIESTHVTDVVNLKGNRTNNEIQQEMKKHDVFLFTSDKNEGWGAVANEAMSNGCVIIASDAIGSVPYLVAHKKNGLVYKSQNLCSLVDCVKWLYNNSSCIEELGKNAYSTIYNVWSSDNAAKSLIQLSNDLLMGRETTISEGPCSKA